MEALCAPQGVRTPILQLSAMQEGDYTFQLTVTDSSGQQDTAQVTVIVQPGKWFFYCFSVLPPIIHLLTHGCCVRLCALLSHYLLLPSLSSSLYLSILNKYNISIYGS